MSFWTVGTPGYTWAAGVEMTFAQTEIDMGTATDTKTKSFTIVDANVSAASRIIMVQSLAAATGKSQDENEMDYLTARCVPAAGSFTTYIESETGSVTGAFKFDYAVG